MRPLKSYLGYQIRYSLESPFSKFPFLPLLVLHLELPGGYKSSVLFHSLFFVIVVIFRLGRSRDSVLVFLGFPTKKKKKKITTFNLRQFTMSQVPSTLHSLPMI